VTDRSSVQGHADLAVRIFRNVTPRRCRSVSRFFIMPPSSVAAGTDFPLLQTAQTHTACCSRGTGGSSSEIHGLGLRLAAHLHLGQRLRMSGAIPLLSLRLHDIHRDNFIVFVDLWWAVVNTVMNLQVSLMTRSCVRR
jgi:hypothetical protein